MSAKPYFPPLDGLEPTRKTLHAYAQAMGVVPRTHAVAHPKWWHVSLKVRPNGLATDPMALPGGGLFHLRMDLRQHQAFLETSWGDAHAFDLRAGATGTEFGDQLLGSLAALGLEGEYAREKFESDDTRDYDPSMAENFFTAAANANYLFHKHQAGLEGRVGQVQLWPHGFDLATEWFGTRTVEYEEHGELQTFPSQLNLGFYPGEPAPYFYSNPWPFEEDKLVDHPLPSGARWFTESWQGSILPYDLLVGDPDAGEKLLAYAQAVHETSKPTLLA